jgi:hypothetical protein
MNCQAEPSSSPPDALSEYRMSEGRFKGGAALKVFQGQQED